MMRIGIDIGGTFTDFVLFDEASGQFETFKILSTPRSPEQAVLDGLKRVPNDQRSSPTIIHGSTVATNATLERKGASAAFIATCGFGDILHIGRQTRPDLYDFFTERPTPLIPSEACLEITERVGSDGQIVTPLNKDELPRLIEKLQELGVESVAVSLLFSFLHPEHEAVIARALREAGFFVSVSSEILPEFREYERASTTAVNAYVSPVLDKYIGRLERNIRAADFRIMQSNGGSIRAEQARREAVRSILSGPAGGVVGAQYTAQAAGFDDIITFDMGGTSSDVSLCRGDIQVTTEAEIGGLPLRIPAVDIHTVGSGGGSIAYADAGGALRVGPESAGSDPGPVCYGRNGTQPTVTDANLVLGRLAPDYFLGGQMALDIPAAARALENLARQINLPPKPGLTLAQTAALGVIQIANAHMERALRVISVERGYDPRDFSLISFGGAGGLHACDLARSLGIRRVLSPPGASTLSAFGMLTADVVKDYVQTVMLDGAVSRGEVAERLRPLTQQGRREVMAEGIPANNIILQQELDMRYRGQSFELSVPFTDDFIADFHRAHEQTYSYNHPQAAVEIVNVRVRAIGRVTRPPLPQAELGSADPAAALLGYRPVVLDEGHAADVPFYLGEKLRPGHVVRGTAVIIQKDTALLIPSGDRAEVDAFFNIIVVINE
ncbi:MAG: hydantoinase/oxoprolinase family protein [Chloroflexi bacterium]|nr:hydantoinase/oxoprolinase family protein [Chloroflexota bacterium]